MSELPRINAFDVVELYQWADELASRPDCASPLGKMAGNKVKSSKWRKEDFKDLALSILAAVATVEPALHREVFRHMACIESHRVPSLSAILADALQAMPVAEGKTRSQMIRLAEAALFVFKTQYQWPKPAGLAWYARFLGIKRQSLDSANWRELIRAAEELLKVWMDAGIRQAEIALDERDLLQLREW